jgi:membrane protease YdiL (CAAX protease family)
VLPVFGGGEFWRWKAVLAAAVLFGLWHVLPSLALGHPCYRLIQQPSSCS